MMPDKFATGYVLARQFLTKEHSGWCPIQDFKIASLSWVKASRKTEMGNGGDTPLGR